MLCARHEARGRRRRKRFRTGLHFKLRHYPDRPCLDVAQQLHAVEAAVANAKRTLIHDHLEHCLDHVVGAVPRAERGPIDEFKALTKYL